MSELNAYSISLSISDTFRRGGAPLSEDQKHLLVGCLSVWLDKYAETRPHPAEAEPSEEISMSVTDKYGDLRYVRDEKAEQPAESVKIRFDKCGGSDESDSIERLRFFCSLAMRDQDWLDVEPFFDAVRQQLSPTHDDGPAGYEFAGFGMRRIKDGKANFGNWLYSFESHADTALKESAAKHGYKKVKLYASATHDERREELDKNRQRLEWCYMKAMSCLPKIIMTFDEWCEGIDSELSSKSPTSGEQS